MTKPLNLLSLILAIAGTAVAGYLTYVHYNQGALVCGIGDCELVQSSKYAKMFGIPIAVFGLLMGISLVGLLIVRSTVQRFADLANMAILVLLISSAIYTAYLTYLEIAVIKAICQWCVTFAVLMLLVLGVEAFRMKREWDDEPGEFSFNEE